MIMEGQIKVNICNRYLSQFLAKNND